MMSMWKFIRGIKGIKNPFIYAVTDMKMMLIKKHEA